MLTVQLERESGFRDGVADQQEEANLRRAEIEARTASADPETAALLHIRARAPVFVIDRLTRLSDGIPVDAEFLRIRADRMTLRATLYRGLR